MTTHTLQWKKEQLAEIKALSQKYPVVAVANLDAFPASMFQTIRKKLHGKGEARVSKVRVIRKALEETPLKNSGILDELKGNVGLVFADMNPFELYGFVKKNYGNAAARAGMDAPDDIVVRAGDTGLPPGPALSDLKGAGLNVRPMGATIHVVADKVVTRKGDVVSPQVASALAKLDIKPIKLTMNLSAAVEAGQLFKAAVLDIDTEKVFADFVAAHRKAFNLAFNAGIFTPETTELLVSKAAREAFNLAVEAEIFTSESVPVFIAKAYAEAKALKALVKDEAPAEAPAAEEKAGAEGKPVEAEKPAEGKAAEAPARGGPATADGGEKKEDA